MARYKTLKNKRNCEEENCFQPRLDRAQGEADLQQLNISCRIFVKPFEMLKLTQLKT